MAVENPVLNDSSLGMAMNIISKAKNNIKNGDSSKFFEIFSNLF